MSKRSISDQSDVATQQTNTTGELTSILDIDPTDGTLLRLLNEAARGEDTGFPIIAKLKDGADNDLPVDTELVLRAHLPGETVPIAVSQKTDHISPWISLSITQQRDIENIDAVKVELKGGVVNIRHVDTLDVAIDSSAQIDWTNSELYFVREAVDERPFEG